MSVRSILPARTWLTALGAFLFLSLAGCQDRPSPTEPLLFGPSMAVVEQTASAPVVTSLADPGDGTCDGSECTLREAIAYADPGAEITFMDGLSGTILLGSSGALGIQKNLTITGPGAPSLSVSGNGTAMVFYISSGWNVTISNLTVTGGYTTHDGGGIWNAGSLTLSDCAVNGNGTPAFGRGAGIYHYQGELTISRCVISGNASGDDGGGIFNSGGTVLIEESTVSGNTAAYSGGGISNWNGTLVLEQSTVSGNSAAYSGGGIYSDTEMPATGPDVTIILNSTISGNSASEGGGLHNYEGLTRIILSTFTENEASSDGGGVWSWNDVYTQVDVKGSILWGNTLDDGTTANDVAAANSLPTNRFNSLGYNLIGEGGTGVDFTQEFDATGDQTGVETANLGGLADNGGPTQTHALLSGSPAINTGTCFDQDNATVLTDQRGVSRPQGSACDIGAFEEEVPTIEVNTLEDHYDNDTGCDASDCTLREALVDAPAGSTITFGVTGTITLSEGDLPVFKDLVVLGPGATALTVDANSTSRVFYVSSGTATISGLSITGGYAASGGGGGIYNAGALTVVDCAIFGNGAEGSRGGGIVNRGTLWLESSTISGNRGSIDAGGLYSNTPSYTTIINSTISGNLTYSDGTAGDGVYHTGAGALHVTQSTITDNRAGVQAYDAPAQIRGSILWGNSWKDVVAGSTVLVASLGHNLVGTTINATFAADGDLTAVTDAKMGPLALNAPGSTPTHALLDGSLAMDAGTCSDHREYPVATDQRGVIRPQGDVCDIGSYETVVYTASVRVSKGVTAGAEDIGQLPFTFKLYDPSDDPVETITLGEAGGSADFEAEIRTQGSWRVEEVLPTGWVAGGSTSCTVDVSFPADHQRTFTCSFDNVEKSRMDLLKLTNGLPTTSQTWNFALYSGADGFGGTLLASDATPPGKLDFGALDLDPAGTYTLCELDVPAGYSLFWQIDSNGDGTGDATVLPYNPNADDDPIEDLGNRCIDIGAGTGVALSPGTTLHFVVNNAEPGGAPRSNGYWKNWNTCTGGGQAAAATANGGWQEGFWLLEDVLTPGIGGGVQWDDILTDDLDFPITSCQVAVDILDQRKVGKPNEVADGKKQASDPLFSLAAHLLAAQLNFGAGVCRTEEVLDWALEAETLLDEYNFDGDGHDNLGKKSDDAARAIELATLLDSYNTGMVCGNGGD